MKQYLLDFLSLIYPRCCVCCKDVLNRYEEHLCILCQEDLPRTHFIKQPSNAVEKVFEGRIEFRSAASWLYFKKGNKTQKILHELKYKKNPDLGYYLGEIMGLELMESDRFAGIDGITPIPIHPKKIKKRGYNQSECLAKGMAASLNCKVYSDIVSNAHHRSSQTTKNRLQRWENVSENFYFNKRPSEDINHLLVIDDVITTGATIESFVLQLILNLDIQISILSLAHTE